MADIELVIKIPEEVKNRLCFGVTYPKDIQVMCEALNNGTLLPKGHGRMKDTDAICKDIISALGIRNENYLLEAEEAVYKRIKDAQTIIEADKAESEGKK